jgi:hypothetical protein
MADSAVVFRKPITIGEHPLEYVDGLCSAWDAKNLPN